MIGGGSTAGAGFRDRMAGMVGMTGNDADFIERARRLHAESIVLDTHCDTTLRLMQEGWDFAARHEDGHVDLPRLREGDIAGVFMAIYVSPKVEQDECVRRARAQIARWKDTIAAHPDTLAAARTAEQVRAAKRSGRIAILLGIEAGHLIDDNLEVLREYHRAGAVYMTLTHAMHTNWADSAGVHEPLPPRHGGLTAFGREVVAEMNRIGMIVDVSHVSDETFWQVLECSTRPVMATHSSCRAISPHRRNLSDEMICALAERGGLVQINFASYFIDPHHPPPRKDLDRELAQRTARTKPPDGYRTPLSVLIDHFDHALQLVGPRHVGIGSDYDGVPYVPEGADDCSLLPQVTAGLMARGYSEDDLRLMLGENVLRVMDACAAGPA